MAVNQDDELAELLAEAFTSKLPPKVAERSAGARTVQPQDYRGDPVGYTRNVLKVPYIWEKQAQIMRAIHEPPYKVMVKAGHSTGKTWLLAALVNYWYDCFNPSAAITTAPSERDVVDLLWTEIRLQRQRAGLPGLMPQAPEMRTSPDHYAKGYTARKGESFQGRHREHMFFGFDEAIGVESTYWTTTKTMFKPEAGHAWVAIFNPTDTTSMAFQEEQTGSWRVFSMSSLDHPNVLAGLQRRRGEDAPIPIPNAVSIEQVDQWVADWCELIEDKDKCETDLEWPDENGVMHWYRPGGEMEARALGLWPSQGTYGVWSEALWRNVTELKPDEDESQKVKVPADAIPEIGNDVARFGDDDTTFHVRWGNISLYHEAVNGWRTTETAGRLIELADHYAALCNEARKRLKMALIRPEDIPIKVDDEGVGGAVVDILFERGYGVVAVRASHKPSEAKRYPNKRSQLWFATAQKARTGDVWLGRLDDVTLNRLRMECLAPRWKMDSAGRRVVEKKDETKKKIGHSPDSADALNLAYYENCQWEAPAQLEDKGWEPLLPDKREWGDEGKFKRHRSAAARRGLFGRR